MGLQQAGLPLDVWRCVIITNLSAAKVADACASVSWHACADTHANHVMAGAERLLGLLVTRVQSTIRIDNLKYRLGPSLRRGVALWDRWGATAT